MRSLAGLSTQKGQPWRLPPRVLQANAASLVSLRFAIFRAMSPGKLPLQRNLGRGVVVMRRRRLRAGQERLRRELTWKPTE